MSSFLKLIQLNENMQQINETRIKRPPTYEALKKYVRDYFRINSFDMFYFDSQKQIKITNNEDLKRCGYIINIIENKTSFVNIINNKKENEFSYGKESSNINKINNEQNIIRSNMINQNQIQDYNFSRYTKCPKVGLKKLGNTSYINAVLQCLNSNQEFINNNLKPKNMQFMEDNVKKMPLSFTISRLFKHLYPYPEDNKKYIYEAAAIKYALGKLDKTFNSDEERDPITLLTFMLGKLHEEYFKSNPNNLNNMNMNEGVMDKYNEMSVINHGIQNFQKNNTFISKIFAWSELANFKCTQCSKIIFDFQFYFTLELNILGGLQIANFNLNNNNNILSINDCLIDFCKNNQTQLMCDHCQVPTIAISTKKIYSPPNYFIFTFNWFFDNENERKKLNDIHLLLKSDCIQLDAFIINNFYKFYRIVGIVSYLERRKRFIAYYLSPVDKKWYFCDDDNVDEITFDEILKRNDRTFENRPYIVIYHGEN